MRRRFGLWLLPLSAILLSAAGCGGSGDPIRIGIITDYSACSSDQFAQDGPSWIAGAELPLLQRGATLKGTNPLDGVSAATIAGRPVELEIGCAQALNPSATLDQLRRLVEVRHVDAVVGPANEIDPIVARYAKKHLGVAFMLASADQSSTLRFAAPNVFRFELDVAQLSAGIAAYAYHRLGWRRATVVGENDPAGWDEAAGFDAEFCALGGHVQRLWAPGGEQRLERLVPRVSARADGVFLAPSFPDATAFIRHWGRRRHNLVRHLLVGYGHADKTNSQLRGVVTVSSEPWGTVALHRYDKAFGKYFPSALRLDPNNLAIVYYDEVKPLLKALKSVHGKTRDGERTLQGALARLHYASPEGPIHLDKRNQAIGPTYLARIGDAGYHQFKVVPNVDQTFGGIFGPHSKPPGPHSPPCVKRKPPPWARLTR